MVAERNLQDGSLSINGGVAVKGKYMLSGGNAPFLTLGNQYILGVLHHNLFFSLTISSFLTQHMHFVCMHFL